MSSRGEKISENVFLQPEVARHFEAATRIPPQQLDSLGEFIADLASEKGAAGDLSLLDVGSGTGRTIIGMLPAFLRHGMRPNCLCFDASESMQRKFLENWEQSAKPGRVRFLLHSADDGLPLEVKKDSIDILTIVSVLHYVRDWRSFLKRCHSALRPVTGLLVQAELIGWYGLLDGRLHEISASEAQASEDLSGQFWRHYFRRRALHSPWDPEIHFAKMEPVYRFCEDTLGLVLIAGRSFVWSATVDWSNILQWIEVGPVSSLASDLTAKARSQLARDMSDFLRDRHIDISVPFNVEWGFGISVHGFRS